MRLPIRRLSYAFSLALSLTALSAWHERTASAASTPPKSLAAQYQLEVTIDDARRTVDAHETVRATNLTGEPLASLVFNAMAHRVPGFELRSVAVNGQGQHAKLDDVVLEIPLPSPLTANQTVEVTLDFKETVPSPGDLRYGSSNGVLSLGDWFPILAVYQPAGWDRPNAAPVGVPWFADAGDYQVTVHGDPHLVIAHTGVLTEYHKGQWTFTANGVRGFAMVMSRRFQSHSADMYGTRITSYFLPEDKAGGLDALNYAQQSFGWYVDHVGPYGYPSFGVAEMPDATASPLGPAYSNLILVPAQQEHHPPPAGESLTFAVANGAARQWFSGLVGSDGVRQPWLADGPTIHLTYLFVKDRYPVAYFRQWSQVQLDYQSAVETWGPKTLDATTSDYPNSKEYSELLGDQSAIFLEHLRDEMGTDAYFNFLKNYVATYRGAHVTTRDFLLLAERYAGRDLSSLYQGYFRPESYAPLLPTATPARVATATARPQPTLTPSPARTLLPSPSPTSAQVAAVSTATQPVRATVTPEAATESSSTGPTSSLSAALGLVAMSGIAGLVVVGLLTLLMLRRG